MCERRSLCNYPLKMDYKCQSDFGCGRRKHHHRHYCDKQFWGESERTWTGERFHHYYRQPQQFKEFKKHNHHYYRQPYCQPEQFKRRQHHCTKQFSPFQQFSNQEGCIFGRHHFHQQFPFQSEKRSNQQCWPFARPEKLERHHKHHCHQQFSPCGRLGKCPQFTRPETCERRHPPFEQFWSFKEPYQYERRSHCHSIWQPFGQFQSFGKPCQFERHHKHHCKQQFPSFESFNQCPQFARPKSCKRVCRCGRFGPRSPFKNFGQLDKHYPQFMACPSFGPIKYHSKCCSSYRRTYPLSLFKRRFCGSNFFENSRIQRRKARKQLGRYQIKHHFNHHKAHRFHHHSSHW